MAGETAWFILFCLAILFGALTLSRLIGKEQGRDRSYGSDNGNPASYV